jgi:hypothetical protein
MKPVRLGLRENLAQFSLLVVVNAFVGAMVGMERSILPAIAEVEFKLAARAYSGASGRLFRQHLGSCSGGLGHRSEQSDEVRIGAKRRTGVGLTV